MRKDMRWRVGGDLVLLAMLLGNLSSCVPPAQGRPGARDGRRVHEFREVHLGMEVRIAVVDRDADRAASAARQGFDEVARLEAILSDWRPASELRSLEQLRVGEWRTVSAPLRDVLALALRVAAATDGAFDPTVGPLTALWREARRTGRPMDDAAREAARARVGYAAVELDSARSRVRFHRPGMRLDLGGVAKGWILDRALEVLRAAGTDAALLEAGGDLVVHGVPPRDGNDPREERGWRIAVPRPDGDTVLVLSAGAVSSSGPTAQWIRGADGARESHVIDPQSGRGRADPEVVTVTGATAGVTDALATALALTPRERRPALAAQFGVRLVSR